MKKFEPIDSSADLKAKWQNQILIIFFAFVLVAVVGLNLNSIVSAYRVFTYDSMISELRDYKNKNGIVKKNICKITQVRFLCMPTAYTVSGHHL